jgi:asparagine synthase (glutamine-hydrolysing)
MDQPSMDGLNTYIVARAVREAGLTVALSGQGGDEMLGGYNSFRRVPQLSAIAAGTRFVPGALRASIAGALTRPLGNVRSGKARDVASVDRVDDIYYMVRRLLSDRDLHALGFAADDLNLTSNFLDPALVLRGPVPGDAVATVGRLETQFYLGNTLLRDGDVFGMANSLEIRVPFLDRDVVDWALGIPGRSLLPRGGEPKQLLRKMCADVLGRDQLGRPKQGFALPIASWMKGPLAELKNDSLAQLRASGLVDTDGIRALEHRYGDDPHRSSWTRVWALVALGRWLGRAQPGGELADGTSTV